ncbi:JAB domain-containing protein [uncultured Limosilactobacillus sp.]|uniref:JAB domain-containing protein n=1 Tax=uncultured Limosilactobacillus sp. TaxID=2837629 RepID=UPI0025EC1B4F|nr:JAB domain-containing protein [uncultured Limosilactobacillus sp.]
MFLEDPINSYQQLVRGYFTDQPKLAAEILEKIPTPTDFRQLGKNELQYFKSNYPEMIKFLFAIQLGEVIVKSPRNIYGHAYSSTLVGRNFVEECAGDSQESVTVLCTDVHNEIIARRQLFIGGRSQCSLYPDQIYRYALKNCASGVIIVHNHPSGGTEPSDNDLMMCQRLERAGNLIGIQLIDFLVIGHGNYYSWRENIEDL